MVDTAPNELLDELVNVTAIKAEEVIAACVMIQESKEL